MKLRNFCLALCALLVACSEQAPTQSSIPPEEVLQRATRAVQTLDSAQYVLQGDFDMKSNTFAAIGTARMDGMLASGGEQLRFQLDLTADIDSFEGPSSIAGTLEVVVISEEEVYMNIHSLSSQPSSTLFRPEMIGVIAGKWWLLSEGDTPPAVESVSPDPRLLQAQAQVVSVTRDRGMTTINGRDVHHYDVALDTEKLVAYLSAVAEENGGEFDAAEVRKEVKAIEASGQLWIDAETYYVQKIEWVVQSLPINRGGAASVKFTITFRNHNDAPAIVPPKDAKQFSPTMFFGLPDDARFPEEIEYEQSPRIDNQKINELIQQMNTL
ncbi:MAG: hypothetical protein QF793_03235 [Candidatus Peribacteraceae bacterium]|jgi:hypothetical protein|nr:hypothetical protein [bacterium]MDP6561914.1 hypothetical protein [Candidatus Peribacteraceae bacterium]|tara:strand:- start:17491 stop:18468 length:978 start_codon:yes stop_codon:yes gene_type:complete